MQLRLLKKTDMPDEQLSQFTDTVIADLRKNGFWVLDNKPAHFIVRLRPDRTVLKYKNRCYAVCSGGF